MKRMTRRIFEQRFCQMPAEDRQEVLRQLLAKIEELEQADALAEEQRIDTIARALLAEVEVDL